MPKRGIWDGSSQGSRGGLAAPEEPSPLLGEEMEGEVRGSLFCTPTLVCAFANTELEESFPSQKCP